MRLNGKVALITGTASGIGYAIAKRYLEADGRVVIADLNLEAARHAAGALADIRSAIAVAMDVADEDQVTAGVDPNGGYEEWVVKEVMLGETVDKQFTTVEDIAEVALMLAAFSTNALTGQSIIVSNGWHMN